MNPKEIGWKDVDWMHLAQNREQWHALVNTVMDFWVSRRAFLEQLSNC
jgi:hypothetical protein